MKVRYDGGGSHPVAAVGAARPTHAGVTRPPPTLRRRLALILLTSLTLAACQAADGDAPNGPAHTAKAARTDGPSTAARVTRTVPVPGAFFLASGYGSLWVTSLATQRLSRVTPDGGVTGSVTVARTQGDSMLPLLVTTGAGSVWVANANEGLVYRVDPTDMKVRKRVHAGQEPWGVAFGMGSLWVADHRGPRHGALLRIDPDTGRVTGRVSLGPGAQGPGHLAVVDGRVWVAVDGDSEVAEVDPRTMRVRVRIPADGVCGSVTGSVDQVWVTGRNCSDRVTRIDPQTNRAVASVRVPGGFTGNIALAFGSVWVGLGGVRQPEIVRIDQASNEVIGRFPVEGAAGLLAAFGSLWSCGQDGVYRIAVRS
jgi:streptogramin lyase